MESTSKKIVTRLAPSPTGFLHIGSLRTALYNFLFARKHHGKFLIRIEDTDRERFVEGAVEGLIRVLSEVGLRYDEGPMLIDGKMVEKGEHGPYTQSERLPLYRAYADQLVNSGHAYYCFCTKDRLEVLRQQQSIAKLATKYDRACYALEKDEIQTKLEEGAPHVIRLKIPEGKTTFQDEIRGAITIDNSEIDDQVLIKSDGFPTYHLAVVVDDHLMEVTHVIRAEEWISSAPKHVILYNYFGFQLPTYAHLPLVLNPDKSKLSKRQGDVGVEDYLKKGYLPEALINFVALLGFNPRGDREIYTLQELIDGFDLHKINKSGAVFNIEKLNWMNSQYIRSIPIESLVERCKPFLNSEVDPDLFLRIVSVEKERMTRLDEISSKMIVYTHLPDYEASILVWKKSDSADAKKQIQNLHEMLASLSNDVFSSRDLIEEVIKQYIEDNQLQNGNVLWPLRVALSGSAQSASPFELLWILGKQESLLRINKALARL